MNFGKNLYVWYFNHLFYISDPAPEAPWIEEDVVGGKVGIGKYFKLMMFLVVKSLGLAKDGWGD